MTGDDAINGAAAPARLGALFLIPLYIGVALNPFNSSMLATALASIGRAFPGEEKGAGWLVATLYLTAAIAQPVLGGIADRIGARRTLIGGLALVVIGSAMGAAATNMTQLVISRGIIGFGAAAGYPCSVVMIRYRASQLGIEVPARILGHVVLISSVSMALGPPLGGLIVGLYGWPGTFLINLPLVALILISGLAWLPADRPSADQPRRRIDLPGIVLFTAAMSAALIFMMNLADHFDPLSLALAIVLFGLLVAAESRAQSPFIDLHLIAANGPLAATYGRHMLFNLIVYGLFYTLPQWPQNAMGLSAEAAGLVLLPSAALSAVASFLPTRGLKGHLTEIAGAVSLSAACAGLFFLDKDTSMLPLFLISAAFGLGNGALAATNQTLMIDHSPPGQGGSAAGLFRTVQYCGAIMAAALMANQLTLASSDTGIGLYATTQSFLAAGLFILAVLRFVRR